MPSILVRAPRASAPGLLLGAAALVAACSGSSSGGGAPSDAGAQGSSDGASDAAGHPGTDGASDATVDAPADVSADASPEAGDGAVPCTQTFTGDETSTLTCIFSLCHPTGASYEELDMSSSGHILRPSVEGVFANGTYADADLSTQSLFFVTTPTASYEAFGGANALPGQQIHLALGGVQQPSADPCDGVAHGTLDVTLVQVGADGGVSGTGRVTAHVTF